MTYGAETTTDELLEGRDLSGTRALITGASAGLGVDPSRPAPRTRQLDGDELLWHYAVFTVRCKRL
jgi:hypothetical protein